MARGLFEVTEKVRDKMNQPWIELDLRPDIQPQMIDMAIGPDAEAEVATQNKTSSIAFETKASSARGVVALIGSISIVTLVLLFFAKYFRSLLVSLASSHVALGILGFIAGFLLFLCVAMLVTAEIRGILRIRRNDRLRRSLQTLPVDRVPPEFRSWLNNERLRGVIDKRNIDRAFERLEGGCAVSEAVQLAVGDAFSSVDEVVKRTIERESLLVGIGTALSPYSFGDAILTLWRQYSLTRQIAGQYGLRPGVLGMLELCRKMLINVATVGVAQWGSDMILATYGPSVMRATTIGLEAAASAATGVATLSGIPGAATAANLVGAGTKTLEAGASIALPMSGPFAQGLLSAVLTMRVGLAAQAVCRPLPLKDKNRLADISGLASSFYKVLTRKQSVKETEDPNEPA